MWALHQTRYARALRDPSAVTAVQPGGKAGHAQGSLWLCLRGPCGRASPASLSPQGFGGAPQRVSLGSCQHRRFSYSVDFFMFLVSASVFVAAAPGALGSQGKWVSLPPVLSGPPPPPALGKRIFLCLVMECASLGSHVSPHAKSSPQNWNALVLVIYSCIKNK